MQLKAINFKLIPVSLLARPVFMLLCCLIFGNPLSAQFGNNWAYSNGVGLDFNVEPPRFYETKCNNFHGLPCTLSDSNGTLVLYFDGGRLYDGNHNEIIGSEPLLNSTNLHSAAYPESSCIFPSKYHENIFYLVYLVAKNRTKDTIQIIYATIEKSVDGFKLLFQNGILKTIIGNELSAAIPIRFVWNDSLNSFYSILGIQQKNRIFAGYHIDSIEFYRFEESALAPDIKFKSDGKYFIGSLSEHLTERGPRSSFNTFQRVSPFGNLLIQTIYFSNSNFSSLNKSYIRICDLRKTNNIKCHIIDSCVSRNYGDDKVNASFVPISSIGSFNEKNVYYQRNIYKPYPNGEFEFMQYDVESGEINSIFKLKSSNLEEYNKLSSSRDGFTKLAPNGIIIIGRSLHLYGSGTGLYGKSKVSAILSPDSSGTACNFVERYNLQISTPNIVPDDNNISNLNHGFPNTIPDYIPLKFTWHSHVCSDSVWFINLSRNPGFTKFTWFFTPNDSLEIATYDSVAFAFPRSGPYTVRVKGRTRKGGHQWRSEDLVYIKPPKAQFEVEPNEGCQYIAYTLRNTSLNDTIMPGHTLRHYWDFGDGHDTMIDYGSKVQVRDTLYHAYNRSGAFDVRLIIDNGFCRDTFTRRQEVYVRPAPKPGFALFPAEGCAPQQITATSHGDTVVRQLYQWGNGQQSEELYNPPGIPAPPMQHTFYTGGTYTITQSLEGPSGCITTATRTLQLREGIDTTLQIPVELADISAPNTVEVNWHAVPGAISYHLSRTGMSDGRKENIANTRDTVFTDTTANTQKQAYRYLLQAADSCGRRAHEGLSGTTLFLKGEKQAEQNIALLSYSAYETWPGGVQRYHIQYRDRQGTWQQLGTSQTLRYTDREFIDTTLILKCYRVVAESSTGLLSHSNELCLDYPPMIWVPTAFTPNGDGLNSRFSAIGLGIEQMTLTIFNHNGEEIFNQTEEQPAWDGTYKGIPAPEGAYLVMIRAKATNGKTINYSGSVTLLR